MQLYHSPTSPFVRKVMVALHETGLLPRVEIIAASGTPVDPGSMPLGHNPLGKVPLLVTDAGEGLFDSRVITRYLDGLAGGALYPAGDALWPALTVEALADGLMEAALLVIYESRLRPEHLHYAPWVQGQLAKVNRALDMLEQRGLPGAVPPAGPCGMAQIAVGCALGYLDFRFESLGWREGRPGLSAWQAGFAARPAMLATRPAG